MDNRNGYFGLILKEDGTYLKLFPPQGNGQPVSYDDVSNYLLDKRISEYDIKAVGQGIITSREQQVEVKILSVVVPQESEYVKISISPDRMLAIGRFYPPSNLGSLMNERDIRNILSNSKVNYGIISENIDLFLKKRNYCEDILLARGKTPIEGKDAVITYHFNTDNTLKPKIYEDGTVDFHQLDVISSISKGDILATLVPAIPGSHGTDIHGSLIYPKKVVNKILKHGKDISLSEDGLTMYSNISGHAILADDKVFVSNTYEVIADVDASTGDIIYEGNVSVKGNVRTGFSIQAKGDIIVNGVVEGATLIAGHHIILKRGMQGMSKGIMQAGGNIITKFIENAEVKAGGYVTTEAILHSKVSAQGEITVGGKKGFITGGEIRSAISITAKTAGSTMGTNTLLEVGIDPNLMDEFRNIEKKISDYRNDLERLMPVIATYKKRISSGEKFSQEKLDYVKLATQSYLSISNELEESVKLYDKMRIDISNNESGYIKIENVAYPGVKVVISNVVYYVRKDVHYSKFVRDRADIKLMSL